MRDKEEKPKFIVRFSPEMKLFIVNEARRNGSSQNSEILRCVRERMDRVKSASGGWPKASIGRSP